MRRNRKKNDILIDLTSLLDVIFILLMVVLARQQVSGMDLEKSRSALEEERNALISEKAETEDEYRLYSAQNDMAEKIVIISVTATFDSENPRERSLKILKNGNDRPDVFILTGGDTGEAYNAFEKKLRDYVKASAGLPVILSLADDGSEILYRDAEKIQDIFNGLSTDSADIYIRLFKTEGE